jgi:peptidoglycan/LPS O-acetylase OafA/YrhL
MPDLAPRVARLDRIADRLHRWGAARVLLAVVAVQIIVLSIPQLLLGEGNTELHGARHLGAFTLAYGAGLLLVVWRPARARSLLPVATTLAVALLITAVVDIATGDVPFAGEVLHLPELASVVLMWALTIRRPRRWGATPAVRPRRPGLRVVDAADPGGAQSETA